MEIVTRENRLKIIKKCRKNDRSAQYKLYLHYADYMFTVCKRFIDNDEDAEEVLQDSFVKAFSNIGKLKDDRKFGSWLKKITINQCINFIGKKRYHFEMFDENTAENEAETDEDDNIEIQPEIIIEEIAKLPERCRIIFNLFLIENYKHKEIAGMLNISVSTSKSQYQRAKQLLKNRLSARKNER